MGLLWARKRKKKPVRVQVFAKTDPGMTRDHNEDCFLVADLTRAAASLQPAVREHDVGEGGSLFLITDGMGGAAAGEVASEMAAETIFGHLSSVWRADRPKDPETFAFRLREAVENANRAIHEHAAAHPERKGMGTTCTAAGLLGEALYLAQVGDSRAYLIRNGKAALLTKDQSLMQRLVDAGEISEEEAAQSERRNIILQALGPDERVKVDLTRQPLRRQDVLVICSDGLSGQVTGEEIAEIVTRGTDLVETCNDLIQLANDRGGPDNVTVIVARFGSDGLAEQRQEDEVGYQAYNVGANDQTTAPVTIPADAETELIEPDRRHRRRMIAAGIITVILVVVTLILTIK